MFVTCSACSARFQLPDDKIAGRKARMKCKACGAPIEIDGMSLKSTAKGGPPPAPSRRASETKPEDLSFNDRTVALGAAESASLSLQAKQVEPLVATDLEDRVTPVSSPLAGSLLDDGYVDAAMDALEQKVFSVPAPKPAAEPSKPIPTPSKPAAEASKPAAEPSKQATEASKPAAATPKASPRAPNPGPEAPKTTAAPKLPPKPATPPTPKQPVASAPAAPAPSASNPLPASAGARSVPDDEEATRMMDLPRLLSGAPSALPSRPSVDGDTEEPTRMVDVELAKAPVADEATRIFDAEPAPRVPNRLPPRPSLPRAPGAPGSTLVPPADATETLTLTPEAVILSDPTPYDAPVADASPASEPGERMDLAPAAPSSPTASGSALRQRAGRPPSDLTVQLARPDPPATSTPSNWGLYLFVLALAATGALVGAFFFARPTFDRAIADVRVTLGLERSESSNGPAFDAAAASAELARVAARAGACKVPSGPSGAGRARVLFQMSGVASSAAISPPFHASPSEACLLGLFKTARVPAFGGQPVIVTKTFHID